MAVTCPFLLAASLEHCSRACRLPLSSVAARADTSAAAETGPGCVHTIRSYLTREACWRELSPVPSLGGAGASCPEQSQEEMSFCAGTMCYQVGCGLLAYFVYSSSISFKERVFLEMSFDLEIKVKLAKI